MNTTTQGSATIHNKGPLVQDKHDGQIGGAFKLEPNPQYQDDRIKIFQEIAAEQKAALEKVEQPEIKITLKDGKQIIGQCFVTTPFQIAQNISKKLAEKVVAARITYTGQRHDLLGLEKVVVSADGDEHSHEAPQEQQKKDEKPTAHPVIWDLHRPLDGNCNLELLDFEDPKGRETFWHSSAHILGASIEQVFGSHLCFGPPLDQGFFYDSYMGDLKVLPEDYKQIESAAEKLVESKAPFERLVVTKEQALKMFAFNPFKVSFITAKVPEGGATTVYRCGKLIDLCTGPHLPATNLIKAFKVTKNSASYWLGKKENDDLQRVYAISFPAQKQLDEYIQRQEELAKRDHRNVGQQQELFKFHEFSPGAAFFFPHGAHIYNTLVSLMRQQYLIRGYSEVISPNMYNSNLWVVSGHWEQYQENMFIIDLQDGKFGFKPMNCPGHCLMFDSTLRSWRDLPMRYADFGVLHRNEVHGALSGLTRVRRFQQDDAHIFCRIDQIQDEIVSVLEFIKYIYSIFGFKFTLALSTRPEKYLGEIEQWDLAEKALKEALDRFGKQWKLNPGDGAFYGPKIDIQLYDAFDRAHQCGTVQLDFQLPIRFNLQYRGTEGESEIKKQSQTHVNPDDKPMPLLPGESEHLKQKGVKVDQAEKPSDNSSIVSSSTDHHKEKKYQLTTHHLKPGFHRPVIIHRAILGSLERFIAILTENTAGKWPFWISPRQVMVIPISEKVHEYSQKVVNRLRLEGFQVGFDQSSNTLPKRVRSAQLEQWNFIAVVGEEEAKKFTVDLRDRDKSDRIGQFTINDLVKYFRTQEVPESDTQVLLKKNSFWGSNNENFKLWNDELSLKTFFDGEGFAVGEQDKQIFSKIGDNIIDSVSFPNLFRWYNLFKKLYHSAPAPESSEKK